MPSTPLICLLERRRDGLGDHLRVGAGIGGAHHHRGRHDLGILGDRQRAARSGREEDQDRQHAAKIGRSMKKRESSCMLLLMSPAARSRPARTASRCGGPSHQLRLHRRAGRTRCRPLTTMRSPAFRPASPRAARRRRRRASPRGTPPCCPDHQHVLLVLVGADGALAHQHARSVWAGPCARARTGPASAAVGVVEGGAQADRAARGVHLVVDQLQRPRRSCRCSSRCPSAPGCVRSRCGAGAAERSLSARITTSSSASKLA